MSMHVVKTPDSPSKESLLEDLALVERFSGVLEVTLPGEVLLHHGLALLAVHVQLAPAVGLVVDLPVIGQLWNRKKERQKGKLK